MRIQMNIIKYVSSRTKTIPSKMNIIINESYSETELIAFVIHAHMFVVSKLICKYSLLLRHYRLS